MDKATEDFVLALLAGHNILTLATVREDGYPQATTVAYANDGLTLYFWAAADSQKVRNIHRCDKVSLTVDRDYANWTEIRGLSMAARAGVVTDPEEIKRAAHHLIAKFPQFAQLEEPAGLRSLALVRLVPQIISVLDYTKGFGHRELVEV